MKRLMFYLGAALMLLQACGTPGRVSSIPVFYQLSGAPVQGDFTIERLELSFEKGLRSVTIQQNGEISPKAILKFKGRGNLRAQWMVDNLIIEQVNLTLHAGSILTLQPKPTSRVPTFGTGQHRIMLKILSPDIAFKHPGINYFVSTN